MVVNYKIQDFIGCGGNIFLPLLHKQYQEHRGRYYVSRNLHLSTEQSYRNKNLKLHLF